MEVPDRTFARLEDLDKLSDEGIQRLLKELDREDVVIGMLEMSRELRNRVFANMSKRAIECIQEDWNSMSPPSPELAGEKRKRILAIANDLYLRGEIK